MQAYVRGLALSFRGLKSLVEVLGKNKSKEAELFVFFFKSFNEPL